jgi:hypothetical protein
MAELIVLPNELDGWDVIRGDDPQALTNHPDKRSAVEAARLRADEEGGAEVVVREDEVHGIDDTRRGVRTYMFALAGLLAAVALIIVVTSLLANATGI